MARRRKGAGRYAGHGRADPGRGRVHAASLRPRPAGRVATGWRRPRRSGVDPTRVFKTLLADGRRRAGGRHRAGLRAARPQGAGPGARRQRRRRWRTRPPPSGAPGTSSAGSPRSARSARCPPSSTSSALGHATVFVSAGRRGLDLELAPADLVRSPSATTAPIGRATRRRRSVGGEPQHRVGRRRRRPSALTPRPCERLDVVPASSSRLPTTWPQPAVDRRVEVDEEDRRRLVGLADDVLEDVGVAQVAAVREQLVAVVVVRCRSRPGRRRCRCRGRPRSSRRMLALDLLEHRLDLVGVALDLHADRQLAAVALLDQRLGSKSAPTASAADSPSRVSMSSGSVEPGSRRPAPRRAARRRSARSPVEARPGRRGRRASRRRSPTPIATAVSSGRVDEHVAAAVGASRASTGRRRASRRPISSSRAPSSKRRVTASPGSS